MKNLFKMLMLFVFLFAFAFVNSAGAASVTLAWDANPETDLAGYRVYHGSKAGEYPNSVDVGNVIIYEWKDLADGTHFFAATAYDTDDNESGYSDEVSITIDTAAPGKPANVSVTITGRNVRVESVE